MKGRRRCSAGPREAAHCLDRSPGPPAVTLRPSSPHVEQLDRSPSSIRSMECRSSVRRAGQYPGVTSSRRRAPLLPLPSASPAASQIGDVAVGELAGLARSPARRLLSSIRAARLLGDLAARGFPPSRPARCVSRIIAAQVGEFPSARESVFRRASLSFFSASRSISLDDPTSASRFPCFDSTSIRSRLAASPSGRSRLSGRKRSAM